MAVAGIVCNVIRNAFWLHFASDVKEG